MSAEGFREHEIPASACPSCGHAFDKAMSLGQPLGPKPGDVTLCIQCGDVLMFTDTLGLRWPTPVEWQALSPDVQRQIKVVQAGIYAVRARSGPPRGTELGP